MRVQYDFKFTPVYSTIFYKKLFALVQGEGKIGPGRSSNDFFLSFLFYNQEDELLNKV